MRRVVLLVAICAAALTTGTPPADARLSKKDARLEANVEAFDWSTKPGRNWASDVEVGRCKRRSAKRVVCRARVEGADFQTCDFVGDELRCYYTFHRCGFRVVVHSAGFFAKGRVRGVRCNAYSYSE